MAQELSPANLITLSGPGLGVTLSPSLAGTLQLAYQDTQTHRMFSGDEVTVEQTALGTQVSVTLSATLDLGSTTFTVIVPTVRVRSEARVAVQTVGITTIHRTSLAPPLDQDQRETYTVTALHGTAAMVLT